MRPLLRYISFLLIPYILVACGPADLSRNEAEKHLLDSTEIEELSVNIRMQKGALAKGVAQGIWLHPKPQNSREPYVIAEKAKEIIAGVSRNEIELNEKAVVAVEVTGMAMAPGAEGIKEVEFDWTYRELPSLAKRFAVAGGDGTAIFRLYDDGWRVEKVAVRASPQPAQMSKSEELAEAEDVKAEIERKRLEEEARRLAAQELQRKRTESTTPKATLQSYDLVTKGWRKQSVSLVLTDVSIRGMDSYGNVHTVLFRDIKSLDDIRGNAVGDYYLRLRPRRGSIMLLWYDEDVVPDDFAQQVRAAIADWKEKYGHLY